MAKSADWLTPEALLKIKGWCRAGLTDKEICDEHHMNINNATLYKWKKQFPELLKAFKDGRAPVEIEAEDTFFIEKLKGRYVEEEITEITRTDDGREIKHIRKTKRWKDADTTALIFFLKCRLKDRYNDKLSVAFNDIEDLTALAKLLNIGDSKNVENTDDTVETVQQETQ